MGRYTAGGALVRIRAMSKQTEDPALHSARREAWVVFAIWLLAMTYTIGVCSLYGYGRDVSDLKFVLGFPDWVFYGIVCPWVVCSVVSLWFGSRFIRDEDLGEELPEQEDELGLGG